MSQRLPVDGVRLVAEGTKQFVLDLGKVHVAWNKTTKEFDRAGAATAKASTGLTRVGRSAAGASTGLLSMAGSMGAAVTGLGTLVTGVSRAVKAIAALGDEVFGLAIRASELQGISMQFSILTQNVEGGSKAMLNALQDASAGMISTRDLMTKFNDAAALVNVQFAQRLPEALRLLSKVSAATGTDMNFLLESLTLGVGRLQPKIIDNLKIQISVAEATAKATEMFGKQADALTVLEKQTALTDLTLAKLEEKFGALPDTTKTLAAQTAALQANFQNIGDTLGAFLVPGFTTLVESVNKVVGAFSAAISEGGALEPLLIKLGAVFSILADGVAAFADRAVETFENLSGDMSVGIADTIEQALRWGVELIAAFAEGIVEATTTVLVQAMNFVSSMLTSWLLGASPPKVAPGIVRWGISLMQMYLEGMTQADFGILKKVQGPLKKVLSGPEFAAISKILAGALAGDDKGTFLTTVGKAAGEFGNALEKLAATNFALADSVVAVQEAENALARSREKILDSQAEVNEATAEYNRLLRAGATENELQAQLGLINAAEQNLRTSLDQVDVQEDVIKAAKERQAQLEAEEKLQQNVVDQLINANAALSEQEKTAAKARAKKGPKGKAGIVEAIPEVLGIPAGLDIGGRIGAAIDAMKAQMKDKLKDIFAPLGEAYETSWKPAIDKVIASWNQLRFAFVEFWNSPAAQGIKDFFSELFPEGTITNISGIATAFLLIGGALAAIGIVAAIVTSPLGLLGLAITVLSGLWAGHNEELLVTVGQIDFIAKHYAEKMGLIEDESVGTWAAIDESLTTFWSGARKGWEGYFREQIAAWALSNATILQDVGEWKTDLITSYNELITDATKGWNRLWEDIKEIASGPISTFQKFVDGVKEFFDWLKGKVFSIKIKLPKLPDLNPFISDSPSPLGKGLKEINQQLQVLATTRLPALANMGTQMRGAMATTPMMSPMSTINSTVNMGGNTFNTGTSEEAFHQRVVQVMRQEFRR